MAISNGRKLVERAIDEFYGEIYAFLCKRLGVRQDAEDVCQTVFLRFAQASVEFSSRRKLRAYLYRIAVNCANDLYRSKAPCVPLEAAWDTPSAELSPLEEAERGELTSSVQRALNALPAKAREVLLLRYFADLKPREIAECLGTDVKSVNNRLYTAKQSFKKEWENEKL